jgi:hypothetical protein
MRGSVPRIACLLGTLAALCCATPASAVQPRIINGDAASPGEYPAQGFLQLSTSKGTFVCGGSLVSNRWFLTAGHCASEIDSNKPLDASAFTVKLGKLDRRTFTAADAHQVDLREVNAGYDHTDLDNDVALLRLATPAPASLDPIRLIEPGESGLWAAGKTATVIGWGVTESGSLSNVLLEATVPMVSDSGCMSAWHTDFHAATMVCAGGGDTDTCGGDSGGPLMVSDGAFFVLTGLTSWGADPCAEPGKPGVYTRLGAASLNTWVRDRVPMARASVSDAAPAPGQEVTFSVIATHPGIPDFTTFAWDFDSDGDTDATGATVDHAYPDDANVVAHVTASGSGPDTATDKVALRVGDPSRTPTPTPTPTPTATPTSEPSSPAPRPDAAQPVPVPVTAASGPLATILVSGRPRVRGGRFSIRVRFAPTAPAKTAVIEAIRKGRVIGIARTKVLQGGTKRLLVKLTPSGRRLLARSQTRRLKFKLRVRVGRQVLRSKNVTVRR